MSLDQAKGLFFDRAKVSKHVDRATRRVLSKFGAFVRTRARSSIRKRKGTSLPGRPPFSHTGLLRKHIYFVYEPTAKSVVIGPAALGEKSAGAATAALERGGTVRLSGKSARAQRAARIRPRPFMGPAFEAERPGIPKLWQDAVK